MSLNSGFGILGLTLALGACASATKPGCERPGLLAGALSSSELALIRSAGPVFMSLTNYQVPMWSVILGILVLGEPVHNSLFIVLILILCGVGLSQYGALKRLFGRA